MRAKDRLKAIVRSREAILLLALVAMVGAFAVTTPGFLDLENIVRRSRYWVAMGMVAVPMTFVIATAGIDLSVGSIVALCAVTFGLLNQDTGCPALLAAFGAVAAGGVAGAFNGGIISMLRVPPLVVTLATMALFRGIAMGLSQARAIGSFPAGFRWLDQGNVLAPLGVTGFKVPISLLALLAVFVAGHLILRRTWMGRFTECLGENETASRFAAIGVGSMKFGIYTSVGLVCGLAALFHTALYGAAKADTASGMELEVIACVVIGGTRISGGQASVLGTLLGLLIIGLLRYGLDMAGVPAQNVTIYLGILLIMTAVFNEWVARKTGVSR